MDTYAEAVAEEARQLRYRQLGIMGTKYLVEGPVYPRALDISAEHAEEPRNRLEENRRQTAAEP